MLSALLRRIAPVLAVSALAACATVPPAPRIAATPHTVEVGIVAINDFHGALEPPAQSVPTVLPAGAPTPADGNRVVSVPAGGAAWLASAIDSVRDKYPLHLTVSAGDMIGASQLSSSLFLDEPSIGVMNRIGVDYNAVGNHEFDRGTKELRRLVNGGCEQLAVRKPCQLEQWQGAKFPFLAANVIMPDGSTLFPGSALRTLGSGADKVTIGLIGLTLKDTGTLVSKENIEGVQFADEADTINTLAANLRAQGADAVVVLIHQGGRTSTDQPDPSGCNALTGDIRKVLDRTSTQVDLVVSGHTHWAYICDYGQMNPAKPFLLTSAGVYGELVSDIRLEIDPVAHKVVAKSARNVIVQSPGYTNPGRTVANQPAFPQFQPRADISAYVGRYVAAAKDFIQRPVGRLAGVAERPDGDASNKGGTLGSLIADAHLAATRGAGAQIAFTNVFSIRAPGKLIPAADGSITFGQLYTVQPFGNTLVTQTLTGAQIKAVLENGFDSWQPIQFLCPSAGFVYKVDMARPENDRVVSMTLNGVPIDPAKDYRVTTNSFLANGGDSFTALTKGRDPVSGVSDIEALEAWLKGDAPRAVPTDIRVVDLNPSVTPQKPGPMSK